MSENHTLAARKNASVVLHGTPEAYCMSKRTENKKMSKNDQLISKSRISPINQKIKSEDIV